MRGKLWFVGGLAVGFVLGARAGREKYDELVLKGRQFLDHPTVQEAAGIAQAQASRLYGEGRERFGQSRLGERLTATSTGDGHRQATTGAGSPAMAGSASGSRPAAASTSSGSTAQQKPSDSRNPRGGSA